MTHASIAPVAGQRRQKRLQRVCLAFTLCFALPALAAAQIHDPTGIKRCFLDRYLDCAEAPGEAARLECYDALLADIPAWLEAKPEKSTNDTSSGSSLPRLSRDLTTGQCIREEQD